WRESPYTDKWRGSGGHAAVLADHAGNYLYVVRGRYAAGLSLQYRDTAARDRRRISQYDVLAAVLARRAAGDHEPAVGSECEYLRARSQKPDNTAAHQYHRHRHGTVILARRRAYHIRIGPGR